MNYDLLVDATSFQRKMTGIEVYGYEISKEIFGLTNKINYKVMYLFHNEAPEWFLKTDLNECKIYKGNSKFFMEQFWIPYIAYKTKIKNVFFPTFPPSFLFLFLKICFKFKIYRTIHDTIMWTMPNTVSIKNKLYMRPLEKIGTLYYHQLFTVSKSSKNDLINLFPKFENKIAITENALKSNFLIKNSTNDILNKFQITTLKYILFVGTIEPRKNIPFLLEIMNELLKHNLDIKLVLAGRIGWGHHNLKKNHLYDSLKSNIIFTDFIQDEELNELYKNSIAFVYPSLYEGFGIPLIEAMKFGTPVVASRNSAIPEALDGAGILIDNYNVKDWVTCIIELMNNEKIRNEFIKKGYKRIKKLRWKKSAVKIIKEIAKNDKN